MQPPSLTPELAASIEALYVVFEGYRLRRDLTACPCCHSVGAERPLYSKPLRSLTSEDLKEYAGDALSTWGDDNDFRHFLPRIFEIVVSAQEFSFADREIVFSKLYLAQWRSWPEPEQNAMQQFLLALWRAVIEVEPSEEAHAAHNLESWLCALAQPGGDLSQYLDEWLQARSHVAVWNLAISITRSGLLQARFRGINAFWADRKDEAKQVSNWLRSDAVRTKLATATEVYSKEPFIEELLAAAVMVS